MSLVKENPLVTDLVGEKTTKLDNRVIFFGECDELSCHIMEIRCMIDDEQIKEELLTIVKELSIKLNFFTITLHFKSKPFKNVKYCSLALRNFSILFLKAGFSFPSK